MNTKILVAYATASGSTIEVAKAIADSLSQDGANVDLQNIKDIKDLSSYNAIIVGAPMILGWHRDIVSFNVENQDRFKQVPVAYFTTQMHLTKLL